MFNPRRFLALTSGIFKIAFFGQKKSADAPFTCAPPKRLAIAAFIFSLLIICAMLLQWNILCTNVQTWRHVNRVCIEHMSGEATGNLCSPLCVNEDIESMACQSFHSGKAAVFTALYQGRRVVFKSPQMPSATDSEKISWIDKQRVKHYPAQAEFINMIKDLVLSRTNVVLTEEKAMNLSYLPFEPKVKDRSENIRHTEMSNSWFLLQSNEYLISVLYRDNDVFPNIVGTCGSFFAVEYLQSVIGSSYLTSLDDSPEEWERRVTLAIMILDYLDEIEGFSDPFHLCNIKLAHFGLTSDGQRLKYLDLDSVHPLSIVSSLTGDGSDCVKDEDCDLDDCRSRCNRVTAKCDHGVSNNNLQIICEKIFLGWVISGRMLVPGLLLGVHAPHALTQLLSHCANPENEIGVPRSPSSKEIRRQLYNALIRMNEWV